MPNRRATLTENPSALVSRFSLPLGPESGCNLRELSVAYPHHRIDVVSNLETARDQMMYDLRVTAESIGPEFLDDLRKAPSVRSIEILHRSPGGLVLRVIAGVCPIVDLHRELRIVQRFPYTLQNGSIRILVIASESKTRQIWARLQDVAPRVEIHSLRHGSGDDEPNLLTPRQREIFRLALRAGYWDVPRRATLADLSEQTHVAKSTLSESLAIIEKKLLEEAFERHLKLVSA